MDFMTISPVRHGLNNHSQKERKKWCKYTKKVLLLFFGTLISLANFLGKKKFCTIFYYFFMCMYLLELIFFIATCAMICFGSVIKTAHRAEQCFWILLSRACTASRSPLFPTLLPHQIRCGWGRSWEGQMTARTDDPNGPKERSIPLCSVIKAQGEE